MVQERDYNTKVTCSKSTLNLIMEDCKEEFLENNPKFRGMHLTQGFMLRKLAFYYLEREEF